MKPTNTVALGRVRRSEISESLSAPHFTEISKSDYSLSMKAPLIPKLWTLILIPLVVLGLGVSEITKDDPNYWLLVVIILWFAWVIYDHIKGRDKV